MGKVKVKVKAKLNEVAKLQSWSWRRYIKLRYVELT